MSQNIANLASARKELAQRKDEVAQCTAELKAARELMATGGSGPKTLTVTLKEIFGDITVDRVVIRPDKTAEIEKVVVEGIPCQFSLEAEVKNFDLVFMAEHSPGDGTTAPDAANDERENGDQTAPAAKPVEEVEADKVVVSAVASTDAVRAKTETEAPASTIDTVEEAESQVVSTGNAIGSSGLPVESNAQPVIDGSVVVIEPPVSGANEAVDEVEAVSAGVGKVVETVAGDEAVDTVEGKDEASPLTEGEISADATSVDAVKSEGELKGEKPGVMEGEVSASDGAPPGAVVEKEAAERMGCSTVTTPLVVPSTELDFKSTEGQWRFLEVPPESEFVDGAIEVTKGVRFSTSLEGHNKMEDESRISELTIMLDEAEQRVRSADAMVEKLKPAASGSSTRKKPTTGGGSRKSTLKKGKAGARSLKSDVGKGKGAVGVLSSTFGKFYGNAKLVGNAGWRSRNLLFFISAVVVIHYHGDYLAV